MTTLTTPRYQPTQRIERIRGGGTTAIRQFRIDEEFLSVYLPALGAAHAQYPALKASRITSQNTSAGIFEVTTEYTGFLGNGDEPDENANTYSRNSTLQEIDFQNHPSFAALAGTWLNRLNDSLWDASGQFLGFGPNAPAGLRGVKAYQIPVTKITKTWNSPVEIDKAVGVITRTKPGLFGKKALRMDFSCSSRGGLWECAEILLVGEYFSELLYPQESL